MQSQRSQQKWKCLVHFLLNLGYGYRNSNYCIAATGYLVETATSLWNLLSQALGGLKSLVVFKQVSVLFAEQEFADIHTKKYVAGEKKASILHTKTAPHGWDLGGNYEARTVIRVHCKLFPLLKPFPQASASSWSH